MRLALTFCFLLFGTVAAPAAEAAVVGPSDQCCPLDTLQPSARCELGERATDCLPPTTAIPPERVEVGP